MEELKKANIRKWQKTKSPGAVLYTIFAPQEPKEMNQVSENGSWHNYTTLSVCTVLLHAYLLFIIISNVFKTSRQLPEFCYLLCYISLANLVLACNKQAWHCVLSINSHSILLQ